jgi:putative FmdB family regulatory protein
MPIYDYKCNTCGTTFEYKQKISEDAITHCPVEICTAEVKGLGEVSRVFSKNIGLVFKGSGFYLTDYAGKKSSGGETVEKAAPATKTTPSTESSTPSSSASCGAGCGCHVA